MALPRWQLLLLLACAVRIACPISTEDADFFGTGVATWTTDPVKPASEVHPSAPPKPLHHLHNVAYTTLTCCVYYIYMAYFEQPMKRTSITPNSTEE
ncbi:MAG: PIN domain-containing protein [Rhodoferax sp.]|uniref:PIN domain-containing protein n=1 Tax=Rhodoferax sp. TaxID=50421 RepID=UPI002613DCE5|nr:PIN domain-containing protein [Rhodoferax sp.]MDD5334988.1 PIN domain-containing protein [Rhodoferax sp.]